MQEIEIDFENQFFFFKYQYFEYILHLNDVFELDISLYNHGSLKNFH